MWFDQCPGGSTNEPVTQYYHQCVVVRRGCGQVQVVVVAGEGVW
ncbi:hypothetical protein A2U01_0111294, partial [Trifolium medium]|nr:hypothetical protein [Trifolium medium]